MRRFAERDLLAPDRVSRMILSAGMRRQIRDRPFTLRRISCRLCRCTMGFWHVGAIHAGLVTLTLDGEDTRAMQSPIDSGSASAQAVIIAAPASPQPVRLSKNISVPVTVHLLSNFSEAPLQVELVAGLESTEVAPARLGMEQKRVANFFTSGFNMCLNCQQDLQTKFCLRCDSSAYSGIDRVQKSYAVVAGAVAVGLGSLCLFIAIVMGLMIR
ncbi:hypothetical protein [Paracoccus sp. NSM]|uniref:hypothetical protein n=1 Tax=Paracoccus sp. NSM TaxID=3457784 RepID=UPI00403654AB